MTSVSEGSATKLVGRLLLTSILIIGQRTLNQTQRVIDAGGPLIQHRKLSGVAIDRFDGFNGGRQVTHDLSRFVRHQREQVNSRDRSEIDRRNLRQLFLKGPKAREVN